MLSQCMLFFKMLDESKCVVFYYSICLFLLVLSKKPSNKQRLAVWRLECDLGTISDPDCPVDGGWSPWGPWSPCQGRCDDVGRRHQIRDCTNPPPSDDGIPCSGPYEKTDICFLSNCTVADFRKLVIGDPARTEAYRQLEAVPALLERCLPKACHYNDINAALAFDNTWQLNAETMWDALLCVKHNTGCAVVGEWSAWSEWSTCGARCGPGLQWRRRQCNNPPPSHSLLTCVGAPLQSTECVGDQCSINISDAVGIWGTWSSWSKCSTLCGEGFKRRKRVCLETDTPRQTEIWGTHCQGQHEDLQICENYVCHLDGGWSAWGQWGPCSQTCGSGKRTRSRSCTRPIPAGGGKNCTGLRVEIGACFVNPCNLVKHIVATFHGESYLHYNFEHKRAVLFQCYIRFLPMSPYGTLVRRETEYMSYIRLSLQKWHVCLDACDAERSCCLGRFCSHQQLEPENWHNALATVNTDSALLRIDDAAEELKMTWSCAPELSDESMQLYVGENFQGQIQELILNFIPLSMTISRDQISLKTGFIPTSVSNVAYEVPNDEEAYLLLDNENFLRLPCFNQQSQWEIQTTMRPKKEDGTILFLKDDNNFNWLLLDWQNNRLKLKLVLDKFRSESYSANEYPPDQWLDVTLSKKRDANAIEMSINAGEQLFALFEEEILRRREAPTSSTTKFADSRLVNISKLKHIDICTDEFFVGGVPNEIKHAFTENFNPFSGVIAQMSIDGVMLDLHEYPVERQNIDKVQVSSRTASISGSYHEAAWGKSNTLNLTCLHARSARSPHSASWLYLHSAVSSTTRGKSLRSIDDGRVLKLVADAHTDLRGFYTCRAHSNRRTRNIVTYGVIGKIQYKLQGPDWITVIAVITTLSLVVGTLFWLIIEGIHDLRNGYGFFRDAHLTPEEEAQAICNYIDLNRDLIESKSAVRLAKTKAWRRAHLIASRSSFGAQEPQGMHEIYAQRSEVTSSEPESLPALPEGKSEEIVHDEIKPGPCGISSPRNETVTSPNTETVLSSSFELVSPRTLCSRLLVSKGCSSKENKKRKTPSLCVKKQYLANIKSSRNVKLCPAHKILQRFRQLKPND